MRHKLRHRGIALMVVLQLLTVVFLICIAFILNSNNNLIFVSQERRSMEAFYAAEAGLNLVLRDCLEGSRGIVALSDEPFSLIDRLDGLTITGQVSSADHALATYSVTSKVEPYATPWAIEENGRPVLDDKGQQLSFYDCRKVTVTATGRAGGIERRVRSVAYVGLRSAQDIVASPFDFAYFMNSWGWFSGFGENQMMMLGNNGANANFDLLSGFLGVYGNPFFKSSVKTESKAAVYASREVRTGAGAAFTGTYSAQQSNTKFREMPNLSNLSYYKKMARGEIGGPEARRGTLRQGDDTLIDGVFGEQGKQSIILDGRTRPLEISGTVVVEGNVVIRGTIKGQGTIVVGRNLYVSGDVNYGDGPSERPRYDPNTQKPAGYAAQMQAWVAANKDKDAVAYAVRKNIVYGNVTDKSSWWDGNVGPWLNYEDPTTGEKINDNHEDSGSDRIWTSRDDSENDGKWTVQAIPPGGGESEWMTFPIVDGKAQVPSDVKVIPGTGEDIDGDGGYTPAYDYDRDFKFADNQGNSISFSGQFFANFPSDAGGYDTYVNQANRIDGFLYTNAAMAGDIGDWSGGVYQRGGVVARQDAVCTRLGDGAHVIEHDERLGSGSGMKIIDLPPVSSMVVGSWDDISGE